MASTSKALADILNLNNPNSDALIQALGDYFDERDNDEDATDTKESDSDGECIFLFVYVVYFESRSGPVSSCKQAT